MKNNNQPNVHAAIFIGKWTPRILFSLKEKPHRHGELRRNLGSISQRMLTRIFAAWNPPDWSGGV